MHPRLVQQSKNKVAICDCVINLVAATANDGMLILGGDLKEYAGEHSVGFKGIHGALDIIKGTQIGYLCLTPAFQASLLW